MTTFDQRDKAFENKFVHDEEMTFKIIAHRNKMLGLWAAAKLGKKELDAERYAKEVVLSDFERPGDGDVVEKLLKDFAGAKLVMSEKEIRAEMERLLPIARKEVTGDQD